MDKKPDNHIFNVGNKKAVTINHWVKKCYEAAGKEAGIVELHEEINPRSYFSLADYEYFLDTTKQDELLGETVDLKEGLKEAFDWYKDKQDRVYKKPYFEFIDENLV